MVNARDFGVVDDGKTDCTAALQLAVDVATAGVLMLGRVEEFAVPAGIYRLGSAINIPYELVRLRGSRR